MGNQYGYTGLTPGNVLRREAYHKGLRSGRSVKVYDEDSRDKAEDRFLGRYGALGEGLIDYWVEGWRDAEFYRE